MTADDEDRDEDDRDEDGRNRTFQDILVDHRGAGALERREEVIQDLIHGELRPGSHIDDSGSVSMVKTLHDKASVRFAADQHRRTRIHAELDVFRSMYTCGTRPFVYSLNQLLV